MFLGGIIINMTYICVKCGKDTDFSDARGSAKHPYCKECFKKLFNDDYDKYEEVLNKTHKRK